MRPSTDNRIWNLDWETMTLYLRNKGEFNWEKPFEIPAGRVILAILADPAEYWAIHDGKTLKREIDVKSVWEGELEEGQEAITLTQMCEKDIKTLMQEAE